MKLSSYLKMYPLEEKPGYRLLYSTKKSSMVLLREETLDNIIKGDVSSENIKTLSKLEMVVSDLDAEKQDVMRYIEKVNNKNKYMIVSVIINLDCNFRCVYCYENGLKGKFYMTDETADLLIDFIKKSFSPEKEYLNIDFYGGEPLLSIRLIKSISQTLKSMIERRGAKYTFTLVTNGALLTRQVAEELVPLGLTGVKITLDGPRETHNVSRPFKSGAGSFDVIINNIRNTCDLIKVAVSGNYQKKNYEQFPVLMDCLEEKGLTPDKIHQLKFDPAINSPKGSTAPIDFTDGLMTVNEPWVIESGIMLREEILKRGYSTPKMAPSSCQVDIKDSYVVNYDGVIYKCPSLIGKKGFEIGNLKDGVSEYSDSHKLSIWKNKECSECDYLPLCFGGCRYMSYVRDGNVDNVDCRKPYLDAVLEKLIKQDIRYRPLPRENQ